MTNRIRMGLAIAVTCQVGCGSPSSENRTAPEAPPVSAAAQPRQPAPRRVRKIETLADFQASAFCERFKCSGPDTYSLKSGGSNTTYKSSLDDVSLEVQTDQGRVFGFGLSFYERPALGASELAAIHELLNSLDADAQTAAAERYILSNVETSRFQVDQAPPGGRFSDYTVKAAKVGNQVVSLERVRTSK